MYRQCKFVPTCQRALQETFGVIQKVPPLTRKVMEALVNQTKLTVHSMTPRVEVRYGNNTESLSAGLQEGT